MIEISNRKIGKTEHKTFTILNDGFIPNGFVQMECRLSDLECEGEAFFMCVFDETDNGRGSYTPLEIDKPELKQFIDYLKECYEALP